MAVVDHRSQNASIASSRSVESHRMNSLGLSQHFTLFFSHPRVDFIHNVPCNSILGTGLRMETKGTIPSIKTREISSPVEATSLLIFMSLFPFNNGRSIRCIPLHVPDKSFTSPPTELMLMKRCQCRHPETHTDEFPPFCSSQMLLEWICNQFWVLQCNPAS